ncbi:hypothetical protein GDO81_014322 [Engystomops pustulosus]|uniref:Snake toxin/toxin-like domain-containing protein n=1 Tax=Engystomops pustulosus TaxID=76066 RepID=A0AAV7B9T2_ENGPU|nr:hypothetical protein GDO81_014322 [Engystomops pustulosus]
MMGSRLVITHLATFLCLAILGNVQGEFITCHSCQKYTNVTKCDLQPPENCTAEKPYCKITLEKTGIPEVEMYFQVTTTKGCASAAECSGEVLNIWQEAQTIWCCQEDLCNIFENYGKGHNNISHAPRSDPLPAIYTIALAMYLLCFA